ncbi:MAG: serine/threonine protein kinase [Myxococcota bacterium]|jgi:serine/threonine-protein kinase|nr:serine/threonine protein kinase [Myxococcota bacterium]
MRIDDASYAPHGPDVQTGFDRAFTSHLGPYRIVGELAKGGMTQILLATLEGPHRLRRWVAIKRILPHLAGDPEVVRMFLDEARILGALHHPNVVQVRELVDGGSLFLVMEYLEGEPVARYLRRCDRDGELLPLALGMHVVAEAAIGLHAAHELEGTDGAPLEVVHREVTPENLFVTYDGKVKVIDFGIAKSRERDTITEVGLLKGKLPYMAPEQFLDDVIDRRVDVFALGVCLYEMTTGRRLFQRASLDLTMRAVVAGRVPPPSGVVVGYPVELERICLRALAHDPSDRYPTAAALAADLVSARQRLFPETVPREALERHLHALFEDRIREKAARRRAALERVADHATFEIDFGAADAGLSEHHVSPRLRPTNIRPPREPVLAATDVRPLSRVPTLATVAVLAGLACGLVAEVGMPPFSHARGGRGAQPDMVSEMSFANPRNERSSAVSPTRTSPTESALELSVTAPSCAEVLVVVDDETWGHAPVARPVPSTPIPHVVTLRGVGLEESITFDRDHALVVVHPCASEP